MIVITAKAIEFLKKFFMPNEFKFKIFSKNRVALKNETSEKRQRKKTS